MIVCVTWLSHLSYTRLYAINYTIYMNFFSCILFLSGDLDSQNEGAYDEISDIWEE